MFGSLTIFIVICLYMVLLFALALRVERSQERLSRSYVWVYGLSLGVFHTSWAFYGNVGDAASHGIRFFIMDLGSYLCLALWGILVYRMVQAKEVFRVTSIADFIAARYNRSQTIAALVALTALFGSVPYVGLQIKAVITSIGVITADEGSSLIDADSADALTGFAACMILVLFTILFGIRRLDPTEHHYGMVVVLALESAIKVIALLAVGAFITFGVYDGFGDLWQRMEQQDLTHLTSAGVDEIGIGGLATHMIIGFFSIMLLPRQFHLAVIENSSKKHIKPAALILALYLLLMSVFIVPLAAAGLLQGLAPERSDMFVLLLPLQQENGLLSLLTFLGGFAAASGMVIITTTTISTMVANHLILPLAESWQPLQVLRGYLLLVRWAVAVLLIFSAYVFITAFSGAYFLVGIGTLAITALLQITPALLGGMFWRKATTNAAILGICAGLLVWFYTLLLPVMGQDVQWVQRWLLEGPAGIEMLKPQALFGMEWQDETAHGVIISLGLNAVLFVAYSLLFEPNKEERNLTEEYMAIFAAPTTAGLAQARPTGLDDYINFGEKRQEVYRLLTQYLNSSKAERLLEQVVHDLHVASREFVNIIELVEFHRMVEHELAGSIGAASSHSAVRSHIRYSERESNELKAIYHHIATGIKGGEEQAIVNQDRDQAIDLLQSRITVLEQDVSERDATIEVLRDKLDERYEEVFRYRMETQRLQNTLNQLADTSDEIEAEQDLEEENRQLKQMYADLSLKLQSLHGRDEDNKD